MASVSSLDQNVKKHRDSQVTNKAVQEVSAFIAESLGEPFRASNQSELQEALKDGVILCRLADRAKPGCVRFKSRAVMPFVQMENIEMFLKACLNDFGLRDHDRFSTVNLHGEKGDMLQVLRCLGAFSRWAHQDNPLKFPSEIGGRSRTGALSPEGTGTPSINGGGYGTRGRGVSNASNTSSAYNSNPRPPSLTPTRTGDSNGRRSPTKTASPSPMSPSGVSSWSRRTDEGVTSPAWNISQYGYMGGASQGNLGVSFGGRRQITSAGPHVPSKFEKEKTRKEKEAEEERLRLEAEDEERRKQEEIVAEEQRAQEEEQRRWAEKTRKLEKQRQDEEKRQWEEQERKWKLEEIMQREEREAEAKLQRGRTRARGRSDARLQGQFLSQYKAEHDLKGGDSANDSSESSRVKDLERQLAEARERERRYEQERQSRGNSIGHQSTEEHDFAVRMKEESSKTRARSRSRPRLPSRKNSDEVWREDERDYERDYLRKQWGAHHQGDNSHEVPPQKPPRPLPEPTAPALPVRVKTNHTGPSSRPLPDPAAYASANPPAQTRTDRSLASNPAPQPVQARTTYSSEIGGFDSAAERDAEDRRRAASQTKTKAGGWASKSLLEREMELERQRQQEWEEGQKEVKTRVANGDGVDGVGGGIGGKWDVNQWTGYTGGDGQNRGAQGIGAGRRQIVGPRPPPPGR